MIATAAMMPTSVLCRNAAAMSRPSRKLWMVSPTMISRPLRPWSWPPPPASCGSCTSQFSVWQWRHSRSFSRTKNTKMPPRMAAAASCALPRSNACGITSRNAAPSSAPIANETRVDTQLARRSSANAASPAESVPPTKLAARIQPSVMLMGAGILLGEPAERSREPYERRHTTVGAVAPVGIEPLRLRIRAVASAEDALHAVEVEQPMAGASGRERVLLLEHGAHLVSDLIDLRADRGAEPCDHVFPRDCHRGHRVFDHAGRASRAPAATRPARPEEGRLGRPDPYSALSSRRAHSAAPASRGR